MKKQELQELVWEQETEITQLGITVAKLLEHNKAAVAMASEANLLRETLTAVRRELNALKRSVADQ